MFEKRRNKYLHLSYYIIARELDMLCSPAYCHMHNTIELIIIKDTEDCINNLKPGENMLYDRYECPVYRPLITIKDTEVHADDLKPGKYLPEIYNNISS